MKWVEFTVEVPAEFVEPIAEILHRYCLGGVAIEGQGGYNPDEGETPPSPDSVKVLAYAPLDDRIADRRNQIQIGIMLVGHFATISSPCERVVDEEDWKDAWKKHFNVLKIGCRIVIVPTWRDYKPKTSDLVIRLDPGMAFGTGHHPTTRMCLELLEVLVRPGMKVLDVGCGSGILAIAAAKLGANKVVGLEIEPTAAKTGQHNVLTNEASEIAEVVGGSLPHPAVINATYDLILANISSKVVLDQADQFAVVAKERATLLVSGVLKDRLHEVTQRLKSVGFEPVQVKVDGDWVALVAKN